MFKELHRSLWATAILLSFSNILIAQKTITGKITGSNDQPVVGATITVKGTNVATLADTSGNFSVFIPAGSNILTISSLGYATREVKIDNRNMVSVSLEIM